MLVLVIMPTFALHELVAYRDRVLGPQSICVTFACWFCTLWWSLSPPHLLVWLVSDEGGGVGSERSVTSYSFTDCVAWWCAGLLRTLRPLLSLFGWETSRGPCSRPPTGLFQKASAALEGKSPNSGMCHWLAHFAHPNMGWCHRCSEVLPRTPFQARPPRFPMGSS